ncbi:hypothetical protein OPU71_15520 [Niveibacterium sp. 24ML]|uniref:hypothetical protein n=1 Tax=Niveibacterium sp. 24ML TaxID=2985512 RepID=UPI00226D6859|nr:hypothetical protein [Niveibacterium sp. 24ML]MCX9157537.1 hypothetical protein [Niveibacterium sp. 24ML]
MICPSDELPPPLAVPRLNNQLLHDSGGLRWHLTALRQRHRAWQRFADTLEGWLDAWRPRSDQLLLVGPSAGWTLPDTLLARFAQITVLEPDPIARVLLARRLKGKPLRFDSLDVFAPGGLDALQAHYGDHAVLFCNLIGQLAPDTGCSAWCDTLRSALARLEWASWHDLAASTRPVDRPGAQQIPAGETFEAMVGRFWQGGLVEVMDHGSFSLAAGQGFACTDWTVRRAQHHLVGWLWHQPNAA